ncbi:MAG TPA: NAD-dependent epimerase/dehydratase family protein [Caulobacteraceae bacterium]|jgi:UDP-glucuronate 4-epimerase|nr:NAD-dependent epimerase/dehydratase family protein [Caulobacteraceae bacterium]
MRLLITGTAGFIGFHLARRLLADGHDVLGIDGLTPYYDVELKIDRHNLLEQFPRFKKHIFMLEEMPVLLRAARDFEPQAVIHLAAQAGVRYSVENPRAYVESNLVGTFNILELARELKVQHLLLASTSSVYGGNESMPFRETDRTAFPVSLYAATKGASELLSHSYSHLWNIPTTAFRFFTVYGPWGRPDMALFRFVEAMLKGEAIEVYNGGAMGRDFTYVDDLVEAVVRLLVAPPARGEPVSADSLSPIAPWRVINIGRGEPVQLMDFIGEIERALGVQARFDFRPMQAGDVVQTFADGSLLETLTGYKPATPISVGVSAFCDWYRNYYGVPVQ